MRIVTDTTPLNYLILIGYVEVLASLYGHIIIPQAVANELCDPRTPDIVRAWMATPPPWCTIHQPQALDDPTLRHLGNGEREALLLVQELQADALLTDDSDAWKEAERRNIPYVRTCGMLERAARRDLLDLPTAIAQLLTTTFYAPPQEVIDDMLARDAAYKAAAQKPEQDPLEAPQEET
jgi:predicted nucleic acid-binding protein